MEFKIDLTKEAGADIHSIYSNIAQDSPQAAKRWRERIEEIVNSLRRMPHRHALAAESKLCGRELRETFLGVYRVIYHVHDDTVSIVTVRHGARKELSLDELTDRLDQENG